MDAILYDWQLNYIYKHPEYIKFEETKTIDILYYPNNFLEKQRQKVLRYAQYFSVSQKTLDYLKIGGIGAPGGIRTPDHSVMSGLP